MNIGILTYHFSDNFGALLQAYALRKWLVDRGHVANFIPYHPRHVEDGGAIRLSASASALKASSKTLYLKLSSLLHRYFGNEEQAARFAKFRIDHLGISGAPFRTSEELKTITPHYDLIIVGSDQIWSPSVQYGFDPAYFLEFAKNSRARRISYAASFGKDTLSAEETDRLAALLPSLSSISVRELSGRAIVKAASGRDAVCVPDPTLLHEQYEELLSTSGDARRGHVFCYALRTPEIIRKVAEAASASHSAPIISPYNVHRRWREIGETVHPGPAEWLSHLANASFVVTNSFHGTVFSILFRKPFLVAELPGSRMAMNARSRNLLAQLGLMDRFVSREQLSKLPELIESPIDWGKVIPQQDALRATGTAFLESELARVGQR